MSFSSFQFLFFLFLFFLEFCVFLLSFLSYFFFFTSFIQTSFANIQKDIVNVLHLIKIKYHFCMVENFKKEKIFFFVGTCIRHNFCFLLLKVALLHFSKIFFVCFCSTMFFFSL